MNNKGKSPYLALYRQVKLSWHPSKCEYFIPNLKVHSLSYSSMPPKIGSLYVLDSTTWFIISQVFSTMLEGREKKKKKGKKGFQK